MSNLEILGHAASTNRTALLSIRKSAFQQLCFCDGRDFAVSVKFARAEIMAAEDELLCWPLESPQEAAMI